MKSEFDRGCPMTSTERGVMVMGITYRLVFSCLQYVAQPSYSQVHRHCEWDDMASLCAHEVGETYRICLRWNIDPCALNIIPN